jgi:dTDP-4-amino-4,6-dideoxygalactose transaminase
MTKGQARVPLVDLAWQHREIAGEIAAGFSDVLSATDFIAGKPVAAFEQEYADELDIPYVVGVANGTDAIEIALRALGVGPGDEVVLPANTFVATAEAVARAGARPVAVDADPVHHLIDPERAVAAFGPRTKAVLPVHLYGQAAPVEELRAAAAAVGVAVVEDAAQSHGATRHGRPAGGLAEIAGTSFYPGKNLGAYGDAGAVLTGSAELAQRARLLANHGSQRKYVHETLGFNSRLDTLQAVVLRAKLRRLARWNADRRAAAERYHALLADLAASGRLVLPKTAPANEHVWHLYVVRVPADVADRDVVLRSLDAAGIGAGIHYPTPVHLQPAFRAAADGPGSCPVAERAAAEILSLPLFPGITESQQQRVAAELGHALR